MARMKNKKPKLPRTRQDRKRLVMWYVLGALIILLVSVLLLIPWTGNVSLGANLIGSIVTPIQSGIDSLIGNVENFTTSFSYNQNLETEYNKLKERTEVLEMENDRLHEYILENERLRDLLGYAEKYPDLDSIRARVIGHDPANWYSVITLNAGLAQGVTTDMIVVNADGLVGRILEVGLNYSKVLCIIDGRAAASGIVERTREDGMINSIMNEQDVTGNLLRMTILTSASETGIRPGDIVKTNGMDRIFPKGITIGTITEISRVGSERMVIISPAADFQRLEDVLIVAGDPLQTLEEIE